MEDLNRILIILGCMYAYIPVVEYLIMFPQSSCCGRGHVDFRIQKKTFTRSLQFRSPVVFAVPIFIKNSTAITTQGNYFRFNKHFYSGNVAYRYLTQMLGKEKCVCWIRLNLTQWCVRFF